MLGFGLFGRIWVRMGPKGDEALRMGQGGGRTYGRTYVRTYGRTDSPCVLQDFVPFGAAAQKPTYQIECIDSFDSFPFGFQIYRVMNTQTWSSQIYPDCVIQKPQSKRTGDIFALTRLEDFKDKVTSDAGSQYCCGRVGRSIQPRSTPQLPPHKQKVSRMLVFPLFDSIIKDGLTDRRTNGWTKPLITQCKRRWNLIFSPYEPFQTVILIDIKTCILFFTLLITQKVFLKD